MPTQTGSIDFKSTKGFQSYASGQYTTKTEFDNLEIGGRNLLYNTADWSKWAKTSKATESGEVLTCTNTDTSAFQRANGWFTLDKSDLLNREIVVSFDAMKTDATDLGTLCFQLFTTSAAPKSVTSGNIAEGTRFFTALSSTPTNATIENAGNINSSTWARVSVKFIPSKVLTGNYTDMAYLAVYVGIRNVVGSAQFRRIKAEFGNRATDWTPAPEDATERIVKAETAIEQTANNVLIKATQSDTTAAQGGQHLIESLINVAPSGVKIAASKVEIDGTAVFKAANAIPDTRNNNQPPSWYFTNYPRQSVTEFKTSSVMGLTGETYCYVTTVTGWNDKSGGYPKQTAQIAGKTYWRVGTSESAWGAWQETESTTGAQNKANEAVNNLEIGGRNLLRRTGVGFSDFAINSTSYLTHHLYSTGTTDTAYDGKKLADFGLEAGNQVTLSFDWAISQNGSNAIRYGTFHTEFYGVKADGTNGYTAMFGTRVTMSASNASGHYSQTMTLTALTANTLRMVMRIDNSCLVMSVSNVKLEKGNKATDWSPAPEDLQSNAVKRTQRIWYRKSVAGAPATPGTASSNWVVKADDGSNAWTKMHISITEAEKFIYTCEQYEMGDGTVGYTSVLLDNTITVIDGGTIITNSVTANQIAASTITGEEIAANTIDGNNIKGSTITAEHLSSAFSLDLGKVEGLKERLESVEQGVNGVQTNTQWVHFDQSVGTVFGREGSANNVTITNEGIDFNTDEGRAAWATGGVFHANEMEADTVDTRTVVMGDWALVQSGTTFFIDYIGS